MNVIQLAVDADSLVGPESRDALPTLSRVREITELIEAVAVDPTTAQSLNGLSIHDRRSQRHEFEGPMLVQPLDGELTPVRAALLVEGRDLSAGGLSFRHTNPLPQRFVSISFPGTEWPERSLLAELTWCTFTRNGEYCSGGRFLRTLND